MTQQEQIIFVDENGKPTGQVGEKLASHHANTRLHLAFSCYVLRKSDSKFLVTQRAHGKKVWPDVWTNSFCGHPMPGETLKDAVRRRGKYELGLTKLENIICLIPDFRYTTPPYNGITENEFCPVYMAYTNEEPKPNPDEVEVYKWLDWPAYAKMLKENRDNDRMSYWIKGQYEKLKDLEPFRSLA